MGLNNTDRQLAAIVQGNAGNLLRDLAAHVAIPTGCNHAPGLKRYREILIGRLTKLGAVPELVPGDGSPAWISPAGSTDGQSNSKAEPIVVARRDASAATPRVLLVGHIDTVHDPAGPFQTLTEQPGGNMATGPGAADMKGGILVALAALDALAAAGIKLNWTFLLNCDEETGSFSSAEILRRMAGENDIGLVFEPALPGGALATQRMGSGQFMIEVFGRASHVGRDFAAGVSAVNRLAQIIVELSKMSDSAGGMIVNVGPLKGGSATNIVSDHAACWGNVRFSDPAAGKRLGAMIDALATKGDQLPRVVVSRVWNRPAKPLTPAVEQLAGAARAVAQELGQHLPFMSTGGVCDGNNLQDAGLPTIDTLGVRGGNLHRTDEFIELPSLVERAQLVAMLLARIAAGAVRIGGATT